jgi:uncharacterized protein
MAALLDVNALVALVDSDHVEHQAIQKRFMSRYRFGWAPCPVTDNGMVRVLSQRSASTQRILCTYVIICQRCCSGK